MIEFSRILLSFTHFRYPVKGIIPTLHPIDRLHQLSLDEATVAAQS